MLVSLVVKPNSKKGPLIELADNGSLVVYIREIAAENKANDALIKLLAEYYDVSKTHITIVRGHNSHHKVVQVSK